MVCLKEDQPKGRERKHKNLNKQEEEKKDDKRMREDDDDPEAQLREREERRSTSKKDSMRVLDSRNEEDTQKSLS